MTRSSDALTKIMLPTCTVSLIDFNNDCPLANRTISPSEILQVALLLPYLLKLYYRLDWMLLVFVAVDVPHNARPHSTVSVFMVLVSVLNLPLNHNGNFIIKSALVAMIFLDDTGRHCVDSTIDICTSIDCRH